MIVADVFKNLLKANITSESSVQHLGSGSKRKGLGHFALLSILLSGLAPQIERRLCSLLGLLRSKGTGGTDERKSGNKLHLDSNRRVKMAVSGNNDDRRLETRFLVVVPGAIDELFW